MEERRWGVTMLWALFVVVAIIVVGGAILTVYTVIQTNDARERRCLDIVAERESDRAFYHRLIDQSEADQSAVDEFIALLDAIKPPLECNRQNIPVKVTTEGDN